MNCTDTTTRVDLAGVRVVFHCAHDDGTASYKVEHDNEHVTVYLHGTPEQLGVFAEAVASVASQRAIREVEEASRAAIGADGSPFRLRMSGVQRWCFRCEAWIDEWQTHAHAERTDCWHPATTAELAQRDRATFMHRLVTP